MPMVDELICSVARAGHLSPEQATQAVGGMLKFLAARLPSPLYGELRARLGDDPVAPACATAATAAASTASTPLPAPLGASAATAPLAGRP